MNFEYWLENTYSDKNANNFMPNMPIAFSKNDMRKAYEQGMLDSRADSLKKCIENRDDFIRIKNTEIVNLKKEYSSLEEKYKELLKLLRWKSSDSCLSCKNAIVENNISFRCDFHNCYLNSNNEGTKDFYVKFE